MKVLFIWIICIASWITTSCARRYPVDGLVIAVRPEHHEIVISHREVEGLMPAMTMPFHVTKHQMIGLYPGARVNFLIQPGTKRTSVHRLRLNSSALEGIKLEDGESLKLAPPKNQVAIGGPVPNFQLTDQSGQTVNSADFLGKVVVVNFIYTRCPLPDVCPRLSAGFAYLQRKFADGMGRDVVLLSVTLDPAYDTVAVLSNYSARWHASKDGWRFLTGGKDAITTVAGYFGMVYWAEEDSIVHSSVTGIIGRDGRLVARLEGYRYSVSQLAALVQSQLDRRNE